MGENVRTNLGLPVVVGLPIARYRLRFSAPEGTRARRGYSGSAWRGGFGHALKRTVCVTRERICAKCLLYRSCVYPYVFETPPPPDTAKMRRYTAAPHPFVLTPIDPPSGDGAQRGATDLRLTLIGRANAQLPYFVHALIRAGQEGIGPGRPRLTLNDIGHEDPLGSDQWQSIYDGDGPLRSIPSAAASAPQAPRGAIEIEILTPLRLKHDGKLVRPEDFRFSDLFRNLLRRVSMLSYFHTDTPLEVRFAELARGSETIELRRHDLTWRDWTRYSSRQESTMQMGGVVGTVRIASADLAPYWPYLWLGQWVHAGKGTSMGLGAYHLRAASLSDSGACNGRAKMDGEVL